MAFSALSKKISLKLRMHFLKCIFMVRYKLINNITANNFKIAFLLDFEPRCKVQRDV